MRLICRDTALRAGSTALQHASQRVEPASTSQEPGMRAVLMSAPSDPVLFLLSPSPSPTSACDWLGAASHVRLPHHWLRACLVGVVVCMGFTPVRLAHLLRRRRLSRMKWWLASNDNNARSSYAPVVAAKWINYTHDCGAAVSDCHYWDTASSLPCRFITVFVSLSLPDREHPISHHLRPVPRWQGPSLDPWHPHATRRAWCLIFAWGTLLNQKP